jgi:hypothetical protein
MPYPVSVYTVKAIFPAPLDYCYAWCTDYTEADRKLQGESGSRQIVRKGSRTVVYEDLDETPHGWMWSRQTVTLRPPNRWTAVAEGNYRTWKLEYTLRELPNGRTEFTMRGARRATPLGRRNPSKTALETELRTMWRNLGNALARDYRAGRPPRSD